MIIWLLILDQVLFSYTVINNFYKLDNVICIYSWDETLRKFGGHFDAVTNGKYILNYIGPKEFSSGDYEIQMNIKSYLTAEYSCDVYAWYAGIRTTGLGDLLLDIAPYFNGIKLIDVVRNSCSTNGTNLLCVPLSTYPWWFIYRKDYLANMSITPPETFDELLEMCDKIAASGNGKTRAIVLPHDAHWILPEWMSYIDMRINGPDAYYELITGSREYTSNSVRKTFEMWKLMFDRKCFVEGHSGYNLSDSICSTMTNNIQGASYFIGDFMRPATCLDDYANKLGVFRFPIYSPKIPIGEIFPCDAIVFSGKIKPDKNLESIKVLLEFISTALSYTASTTNERVAYLVPVDRKDIRDTISQDSYVRYMLKMLDSSNKSFGGYSRDQPNDMALYAQYVIKEWVNSNRSLETTDNILRRLESKRLEVYLGTTSNPVFSSPGGNYKDGVTIKITCINIGPKIYYTLDGTLPNQIDSIKYENEIRITTTTTIRSFAVAGKLKQSDVVVATYTIIRDTPDKTIYLIIGVSIGILFLVVGLIALGFALRQQIKLKMLYDNKRVAESCADAIANLDFDSVAYLDNIPNPDRIQTAFKKIIMNMKYFIKYLPDTLVTVIQNDTFDDKKSSDSEEEVVGETKSTKSKSVSGKISSKDSKEKMIEKTGISKVALLSIRHLYNTESLEEVSKGSKLSLCPSVFKTHQEFVETVCSKIKQYKGTIHSVNEDRIICHWNGVTRIANAVQLAASVAFEVYSIEKFKTSISLCYGGAWCATLTTPDRNQFTVFSNMLHQLTSMELLSIESKSKLLCNAMANNALSFFYISRPLCNMLIDGYSVDVFEVTAPKSSEMDEWMYQLKSAEVLDNANMDYLRAIQYIKSHSLETASELLSKHITLHPGDNSAIWLLENCKNKNYANTHSVAVISPP